MKVELTEALWLEECRALSSSELVERSGLSEEELRELVDYGALVPINSQEGQWTFSGDCILTVRTACRLRDDFDLDPHALALAISFLDRIRDLEAQLRELRAQLPRRPR